MELIIGSFWFKVIAGEIVNSSPIVEPHTGHKTQGGAETGDFPHW